MGVCIGRSLLGLEAEEPVRKGFVTTEERVGRGESSKVYRDIKSGSAFFFFFGCGARLELARGQTRVISPYLKPICSGWTSAVNAEDSVTENAKGFFPLPTVKTAKC